VKRAPHSAALRPAEAKEEMKEWDQFKVNEERFGVKSTYQEARQAEVLSFFCHLFWECFRPKITVDSLLL